ncbi:MAG: hypothetical protein KDA61_19845 [Planctomycetales bacterium]|nr:hypothetical protein [Planctomycetales bacterium]
MSHYQTYEQDDMNYAAQGFRRSTKDDSSKRRAPAHGRRRGKAPQSVNGIHRRRNRKITW